MEVTTFPRTDKQVGRLGFGAMGFAGWFGDQPEAEHVRALHYALDRGVNLIDTARAYGESERIVGTALRQWRGAAPFVATKVQGLGGQPQWGTPVPVELSFPKGQVTRNCEESLRTLGLDVIDCLQLHTYWATWGTRGYWLDELQELKRRGKVRTIGVSVPDHRSDMVLPLVMSGQIDAVQTVVNIFDPTAIEVLVPFCRDHDVAVIARCIFDEGGLTGFLSEDTVFPPGDFRDGYFDATVPRSAYIAKVDALRRYVPEHAGSLAALAVRFALHSPGVTTALTSMHDVRHAAMNIDALEGPPLDEEVFRALMFRHRFIKNFANFKNFGDGNAIG